MVDPVGSVDLRWDAATSAYFTPPGADGDPTWWRPPPQVEFRDVSFRFPTRPEVLALDRVRLRLTPGRLVALVGSSGSGKSTLVGLLQRLYDATEGQVPLPHPSPTPSPCAHARGRSCRRTCCLSPCTAYDDAAKRAYTSSSCFYQRYRLHTPCAIVTCDIALKHAWDGVERHNVFARPQKLIRRPGMTICCRKWTEMVGSRNFFVLGFVSHDDRWVPPPVSKRE